MRSELLALMRAAWTWMRPLAGEDRLDQLLRLLTAAVVLLFPGLCLLLDRSDSYSLLLLLLVGIVAWVRQGFRAGFSRSDWFYVGAFAAFFATGLLAYELGHQTDGGFHLLGRYLRLLLVLPALVALKRYRPPAMLVWTALGLASLALGVDALWEHISATGFMRPDGDTNVAILFGDLATATTFAFAAGYIYVDTRLPRLGPRGVTLCVFAGLLACFLSGTRGAWLALPVLLILFLTARHLLHPRTVLLGAGVVVAIFGLLCALPRVHVWGRLAGAYQQVNLYLTGISEAPSVPAYPACMQQPKLLAQWASLALPGVGSRFDLRPVPGYKPAGATPCRAPTVLQIHNLGGYTWLQLPHYVGGPAHEASLNLLASGEAYINFGVGPRVHVHTNSDNYQMVRMHTSRHLGDLITLTMRPHASVWIIPIETYPGEFHYTFSNTSIGQRLAMWSTAWRLFLRAPIFGVGTGAYMAEAGREVAAGKAPSMVAQYDHPHNDYLDALSSRGLVGFLALLLLLGVPSWQFCRGLRSRDAGRTSASLAGLMVTVGFAIFALSETMFIHSITLGWYVIMTAIFMVTAAGGEQGTSHDDAS